MNPFYKKCVVASTGLHVLLGLILIFCPAFLASSPKQSDVQPLFFIPDILTESPFAGGGNPNAGRPAAAKPAPPAPAPEPAPAPPPPQAKPKVREVAPPEPDEESLEVSKEAKPKRNKPEVTTTAVVRTRSAKPSSEDTSEADRQAQERKERLSRLAGAFDRSLTDLRSGTGSAARLEGSYGPGGGGPSYAGYAAWVLTVFDNAWVAPEDASSDEATVEVKVTVANDGTVTAKRIIKRSGDAAVDASVQRALDRVNTIGRPFPESMKDRERTYIIPFNVKSKRGTP